ncbi:hypothetical protein M433DRAFT_147324 [Acidomyces richmondensis BFW]|nr:MAG: hypothetical protein FE78DRAFT_28108 [Acidomyces sp. 'richmondensis']KYG41843.1 hypothetical protein M433DRAFT_147324 [Acidomyces richmondensis BFW]
MLPREIQPRPEDHDPLPMDRRPPPDAKSLLDQHLRRPHLNTRSSTDPSLSSSPSAAVFDAHPAAHILRPSSSSSSTRNRSPYSRAHLRSRSSNAASLLSPAPAMTRAHSLPNPHTLRLPVDSSSSPSSGGSLSPGSQSPLMRGSGGTTPARTRSPFKDSEIATPRSPSFGGGVVGGIESIHEERELDLTERQAGAVMGQSAASFPRSAPGSTSSRRRPASPLHSLAGAQQHQQSSTSSTGGGGGGGSLLTFIPPDTSPRLGPQHPQKYNESYPRSTSPASSLLHHSASTSSFSSIPSTPTSARSRSPSISSLETIEDAPDLESEAEQLERLKMAAEREEEVGGRRSSLDVAPGRGGGFGFGRVGRERKRWSVCGGERRGDLDLETIWED